MLSYVYYSEKPVFYRYIFVLFIFMAGLLAKPMLVTLPFVFLLLDFWPLNRPDFYHPDRKQRIIRLLIEKIPLLLISLIFVYMTISSLHHRDVSFFTEKVSLKLRIDNALVSYWIYLGKMIYPKSLSVFYPHPASIPLWQSIGAGLLLLCTSYLFIRMMKGRPYAITGWLWYLGTLVPVLGITRAGRWPAVADRWTYVPLIGIYVIIAWGGYDLIKTWRYKKLLIISFTAILLSSLMIRTYLQLKYWTDSFSLFTHAINVNPENDVMHYNLGCLYAEQGNREQAVFHYSEALRIHPDDRDSHFNLGGIMAENGDIDRALFHYSEAIRIYPADMDSHNNMGLIYINQNRPDEAISHFKIVLRHHPEDSICHNNMGIAQAMKGDIGMAILHFEKALEINPDNASAKNNLSKAQKLKTS
jgi:tetratricopeptide (TPR) repeat protein